MNDLSIRPKSVYLCGDYNIDLLKIHTVEDYSSFFDNVIAPSFVPIIEVCSQENMDRFKIEVENTDLYNKLNQDLNTDPNYNYDILSAELQAAKNLHIPRIIRKFNRRKHKKEKMDD